MREFKLSSGHFWREFARLNLVGGPIIFLLSIIRYKEAPPFLPVIVLSLVNFCCVIHHIIWPPLKGIVIEPAAQELTYKLLWRHPVKIKLSQLIVKSGTWATRGGFQTGLLFYIGFELLFRAAKGPWKENDLAEIYQLVSSTPKGY
jgi:hypothetical protein